MLSDLDMASVWPCAGLRVLAAAGESGSRLADHCWRAARCSCVRVRVCVCGAARKALGLSGTSATWPSGCHLTTERAPGPRAPFIWARYSLAAPAAPPARVRTRPAGVRVRAGGRAPPPAPPPPASPVAVRRWIRSRSRPSLGGPIGRPSGGRRSAAHPPRRVRAWPGRSKKWRKAKVN